MSLHKNSQTDFCKLKSIAAKEKHKQQQNSFTEKVWKISELL